jgi:predicted NodU family carbamoyl transferase
MRVLGVNALFQSAALVVDGVTVAAAEEERFSRRKHGHRRVPFAAWELPELAARWCLAEAGTALGGALHVAAVAGDEITPMVGADLGRGWTDDEIEAWLRSARLPYSRSVDLAAEVADCLAADGVVAWFQGRSEFGPRALGHRSLLAIGPFVVRRAGVAA